VAGSLRPQHVQHSALRKLTAALVMYKLVDSRPELARLGIDIATLHPGRVRTHAHTLARLKASQRDFLTFHNSNRRVHATPQCDTRRRLARCTSRRPRRVRLGKAEATQLSAASAHGRDRLSCATRKGARMDRPAQSDRPQHGEMIICSGSSLNAATTSAMYCPCASNEISARWSWHSTYSTSSCLVIPAGCVIV
jgi:hypothetical protein